MESSLTRLPDTSTLSDAKPEPFLEGSPRTVVPACCRIPIVISPSLPGLGRPPLPQKVYVGLIPRGKTLLDGLTVNMAECDDRHLAVVLDGGEATAVLGDRGEPVGCGSGETIVADPAGGVARQVVFAVCIWLFWLAFIASTMGHAPKKVGAFRP